MFVLVADAEGCGHIAASEQARDGNSPPKPSKMEFQRWARLIGAGHCTGMNAWKYCGADPLAMQEQPPAVGFPANCSFRIVQVPAE